MSYPSAHEYNESIQNPGFFFSDPDLKSRLPATDVLGLPEVLAGSFAFTYRLVSRVGDDLAVRCFHREIPELFERYSAISKFLGRLRSKYFVDFQLQNTGIRVGSRWLPIVRMSWINGDTLLDYVRKHRSDPTAIGAIREQLRAFSREAESHSYAHGDIQPRNLIVASERRLKFVDYDGMFVPELSRLASADLGHPDFQSPKRTERDFSAKLDVFSLAVLDLNLHALQICPALFTRYHNGENLILSRSDFLDPFNSRALAEIENLHGLKDRVRNLRDVCHVPVNSLPASKEFLIEENQLRTGTVQTKLEFRYETYSSSLPVVDGMDYSHCALFVGRRIELIGEIQQIQVRRAKDWVLLRFGQQYRATPCIQMPTDLFQNWSGGAFVKSNVWVDASKIGLNRWVSGKGTLEAHRSGQYATVQLSITNLDNIETLPSKDMAEFRLGRKRLKKTVAVEPVRWSSSPPEWLPPERSNSPESPGATAADGPESWMPRADRTPPPVQTVRSPSATSVPVFGVAKGAIVTPMPVGLRYRLKLFFQEMVQLLLPTVAFIAVMSVACAVVALLIWLYPAVPPP